MEDNEKAPAHETFEGLEERIGYSFREGSLLAAAMTHPSYRAEQPDDIMDNQRLEFVGDAVIGLLAASFLYDRTDAPEGGLTTMRSRLTDRSALSRVAAEIHLQDWLRLGKGEARSGGRRRPSSLCDALEALFGAVYMDGGMPACSAVFARLFERAAEEVLREPEKGNPKGVLQEYSQALWKESPVYQLTDRKGPQHASTFYVTVLPAGRKKRGGIGPEPPEGGVGRGRGDFSPCSTMGIRPASELRAFGVAT